MRKTKASNNAVYNQCCLANGHLQQAARGSASLYCFFNVLHFYRIYAKKIEREQFLLTFSQNCPRFLNKKLKTFIKCLQHTPSRVSQRSLFILRRLFSAEQFLQFFLLCGSRLKTGNDLHFPIRGCCAATAKADDKNNAAYTSCIIIEPEDVETTAENYG